MRVLLLFFLLSFTATGHLHSQETEVVLLTDSGRLKGTLLLPARAVKPAPVVLIIAGSGPTDRNGNNSQMENNCLKMMADTLAAHGIASLRYDKRGVGQSDRGATNPQSITFEHFVRDAQGWLGLLAADQRFGAVIVAGHSEGSLVGMIAAQRASGVSAFISIAGAGRPLDVVLKDQLSATAPEARGIMYDIIDRLKGGDTVGNVPPLLAPLFRRSVQPFLIDLFSRNPVTEMARLDMPVLVLQGSTDLQVKVEDAELLAAANPSAKLSIMSNMNHVLKDCATMDRRQQIATYDNPLLPLHRDFARTLARFCREVAAEPRR